MTFRLLRWFLILVFLSVSSLPAFAKKDDAESGRDEVKYSDLDRANKAGEIRGVFQRCGPNGSAGVFVYIIGRSFSALLPSDGRFTLSYVPPGIYNLAFVEGNNVIATLDDVQVRKHQLTDLGDLRFCPDADNDGFDASVDCNDNNPNVHPGAAETCDSLDNDCNGAVDDVPGGCVQCTDADRDGYFAQNGCGTPVDCDDSDPTVSPAAQEVCFDNRDNNCDGQVDENCGCPSGTQDCDGNGTCETDLNTDINNCGACGNACPSGESCEGGACTGGGRACTDSEVSVLQSCLAGCDTAQDPLTCTTQCLNQVSGACATAVQQLSLCALSSGCPLNQSTELFSLCVFQNCPDEWQAVLGTEPPGCPAGETNCNGQCVDLQTDSNNCGQCGTACSGNEICSNGTCRVQCGLGETNCAGQCVDLNTNELHCGGCNVACGPGDICDNGVCRPEFVDNDRDGFPAGQDCNDNDPNVFPGNVEFCNNKDDNCDGQVDENIVQECYTGPLGTEGVGVCRSGFRTCQEGQFGACSGEVTPSPELCDGLDNDCDGTADEGNPGGGGLCNTGFPGVCGQGVLFCSGTGNLTCVPTQQPGAEVCDGQDNDCDGQVDEGGVC